MSTLSLRKIKHDSSSVDNIVTNTDGGVGIGGIDPSTLPSFVHHAVKVQNGGGLGIQSDSAADNRWIFFGHGTTSGDVQRAGIVNQGSDQSLALTTAGIQRLIVDSSGRITTPYQTYALCGFTSAYNSFTVSSNNDIIMDTATQRGSSYNTSNGRFTAPVNGLYHIFISLMMNPPSTNANRLALRKNGSDFQISFDVVQPANGFMQGTGGGSQQSNLNLTCILPLNAGDYVNFAARSGSSVGPIYGGHSWGFFYLIG